jgi:hypothetical protein
VRMWKYRKNESNIMTNTNGTVQNVLKPSTDLPLIYHRFLIGDSVGMWKYRKNRTNESNIMTNTNGRVLNVSKPATDSPLIYR